MAASKEAICIILDVGSSMGQAGVGTETFLETSIEAITMIIQRKVFAESKDEIALVLFGTPETDNTLDDGLCYQNISVIRPLGIADFDLLEMVQKITPSDMSADFIDALVVGLDHITKGTVGKRGFASKRLLLFSDLGGVFGDDQIDVICEGIKQSATELNVIGPDLDDGGGSGDQPSTSAAAYRKDKTLQQREGEGMLRRMLARVEGESYSFREALPALSHFQARQVRPTAWKCPLEISANLAIPIAGYIKVKDHKLKQSWKNSYAKNPEVAIAVTRSSVMNNDEETEVDKGDIIEGHCYGNTLVPMTEDDKENMKYRAEKCFKVLGFTKSKNVKRHQFMGDSVMIVVAEKDDQAAAVALSALINALYETNMVAIVRRVYSNASSPRLGVLTPFIKAEYESFLFTELPFSEDVRQFMFGSLPLDADATVNQKYTPSEAQLSAVDGLISSMDLTNVAEVDGEKIEALKPKLTFNPYFQRLYQCLQQRAVNSYDPLPELSPLVASSLQPPQELVQKRQPLEDKLKELFKLDVVRPKKDEKTGEELFQQINEADDVVKKPRLDDALEGGMGDLLKAKVTEVGTVTPVDDFRCLVSDASADGFDTACEQLQTRLSQIVMESFGSQFYPKAMACVRALRAECCQSNKPYGYNAFIREFKDVLIAKCHRDFWDKLVSETQALLTKLECEASVVSKEEADDFMKSVDAQVTDKQVDPEEEDDDEDDLLANL